MFEVLETAVVNDVMGTFDDMLAIGWSPPAALDAIRSTYRTWVLARIADAIELGLDLVDLKVVA